MDIRDVVAGKYTKQEIFDFVVEKLRAQGCSSDNFDSCLYRGPNGTKCAIGHMIPGELYNPGWEGASVRSLAPLFSDNPDAVDEDTIQLLCQIQSKLHDEISCLPECDFLEQLEEGAFEFAEFYNLNYTPPPENP